MMGGRAHFSSNPPPKSRGIAIEGEPDGSILVGGWFTNLAGAPRNYLGRLLP
jgi:hypothetical protein